MKAGEWLYLCVAHGNNVGGHVQCCAIDYIVHTLDSATALLNSTRVFPSRLSVPPSSYRHFSSLARRLSRIFAHAFYHHRELFSQAEAESSLYARFLSLSHQHSLVPPELLVIPLEGLQPNHANEHTDTLGEYEHEPGSPQTAIEADGGTFLPGYAHERPAPQSRQLFDDGSTGVDDSNEEYLEEPELSEESGPEESEPAELGQHDAHESAEATTTEVHDDDGSTEELKQPDHVEGSADADDSSAGSLVREVPSELTVEKEPSNGEANPGEDTQPSEQPDDARPASPHENGGPTHEGESAPKEDPEQHKEI
ncbi:hypothetical protein FRC10_003959 [Ceratobasidium sp. 414]|nr:hypothetical protein FRC10_003959 [Ceratobasidium sp. 414]